jgi:hypothetical protein
MASPRGCKKQRRKKREGSRARHDRLPSAVLNAASTSGDTHASGAVTVIVSPALRSSPRLAVIDFIRTFALKPKQKKPHVCDARLEAINAGLL